jgi:peptidyl-prolyl cis-trans isomerase D
VGGLRIGSQEFDDALRRQADQYRQQFGPNFDASIMDNPEMRRGVLDRLVNERLAAVGAQEAGIRVGDKQLADRIKTEQVFQDEKGQFSQRAYESIAKQEGLTPIGLDERIRESMRLASYRDAIAETAFVPRSTLDNFIRLSEQSREVSVVNFAQPPACIRHSSRGPLSNSWLPTALRSRPTRFIAAIVGSSRKAPETRGEAPIRSPAETVIE